MKKDQTIVNGSLGFGVPKLDGYGIRLCLTPQAERSECNLPGTIRPLKGHFLINDKMICKFQFPEFMVMS